MRIIFTECFYILYIFYCFCAETFMKNIQSKIQSVSHFPSFFLGGQRTILNYFLAHCGACMYVVLYIFTYPVQFPLIDPSAANSTASSP